MVQRLLNDVYVVDTEGNRARYNAVYGGKSPEERLIIEQMTAAWTETRQLDLLYAEEATKVNVKIRKEVRGFKLMCASYAEHALKHWEILTRLLGTDIPGVAAAMDAKGRELARIGWIAPRRACLADWRMLKRLFDARRPILEEIEIEWQKKQEEKEKNRERRWRR